MLLPTNRGAEVNLDETQQPGSQSLTMFRSGL